LGLPEQLAAKGTKAMQVHGSHRRHAVQKFLVTGGRERIRTLVRAWRIQPRLSTDPNEIIVYRQEISLPLETVITK
jgi:hypothetical protein